MSSKNSTRRNSKKYRVPDSLEDKIRGENVSKIRNIFEIKRPHKPAYSTLRKSNSTEYLSTKDKDEEETNLYKSKVKQNYGTNHKITRSKSKNDTAADKSTDTQSSECENKIKANIEQWNKVVDDIEQCNKLMEKFGSGMKKLKECKYKFPEDNTNSRSNFQTQKSIEKNRTKNDIANEDSVILNEKYVNDFSHVLHTTSEVDGERRFIKNPKTSKYFTYNTYERSQNYSDKTNKGITVSRRSNQGSKKEVSSFIGATDEEATEKLRKSLVLELDFELAKMKEDGFIDEDENTKEEQFSEDLENEVFQDDIDENLNNETINTANLRENISNNDNSDIEKELSNNIRKSRPSKYRKFFETLMELDQHEAIQNGYHPETKEENSQGTEEGEEVFPNNLENITDDEPLNILQTEISNTSTSTEDHKENKNSNNENNFEELNRSEKTELKRKTNGLIRNLSFRNPCSDIFADAFSESLGDDLENGSYFVEAYNKVGSELVIVQLSVERISINIDKPLPLESLENKMKNSDLVFHKKDNKSFSLVNNSEEFVNENSELVSCQFPTEPESNRSTIYSTTSKDSDEDDEGISMSNIDKRNNNHDDAFSNVRRETFCDQKGIIRIERVGKSYQNYDQSDEDSSRPHSSLSRRQSTQRGKLSYIIEEIKSTEIKYVKDLIKVVNEYKPYIEKHMPIHLKGKQHYIFGNIEILLQNQEQFLAALQECSEDVADITHTFIKFKNLFKLYPAYFKNKPRADMYLKEFSAVIKQAQEEFNERLDLSSYLLTPLQRLGKYKLFLENIEKQLIKLEMSTDSTKTALEIIKTTMSKGNDYVAIESIMNSPIDKLDYGSFKMREQFIISKPRRMEAMVFLFENIIVFTYRDPKNMDMYLYLDSIKMNDLRIATFEDLTIHLTDFTKSKKTSNSSRYTFILEAKTEKIKDTWTKQIEDILWQQLYKVKENTLKFYKSSKASKKDKTRRSRIKSAGASVFYIEDDD